MTAASVHPARACGSARGVPLGVSVDRLRGALLWLTGMAGAFGFVDPSPYELVSLLTVFFFAVTGLAVHAALLPLALLLALYNIGFSIAVVAGPDAPDTTSWVLISWYLSATALFFAAVLGVDTERRLAFIVRGTMVAACIASVAAIIGYSRLFPGLSDLLLRFDRARGTFNDPNVLGAFLGFPMLVALGRVLTGRARDARRGSLWLALFATALLLSFSRGAWAQFALSAGTLTLLGFLTSRSGAGRLRIVIAAVVGAGLIAALVAALLSIDSVAELFKERASLEQSYDLGRIGRFGRYELGALLALDHPLGLGPLQFRTLFVEDPHNAYLNAFLSGGWLSGVCYLTLSLVTLVLGLRYAFVATPWQPAYLAVYCAFVGAFGESLVIDSNHWRHYFLLLGVLWGLMIAARRYLAPRPRTARVRPLPVRLGLAQPARAA